MKKYFYIALMIGVVLSMVACGSVGETDLPLEPAGTVKTYPGETGITIGNAEYYLPENVFTMTGEENGLAGTCYFVTGLVTQTGEQDGYPYFIVSTDSGDAWISDVSEMTLEEAENSGSSLDAEKFETFYPHPEVGENVRVFAEYQGMSGATGYASFIYGDERYLAAALARSSKNPLIAAELETEAVMNGSKTDILGFRAHISMPKAALKEITLEQYTEFCNTVLKDSTYNWVSIRCDDGTGIQFTGSQFVIATYGTMDYEGIVVKESGYIKQTETGFEYEACE